uniref:uncharacterized protein n=1 Tax=Myxine glutinosa TaxID=7769 RepID=UPI0035901195
MPRKRPALGRNTAAAKRFRAAREAEQPEQRQVRLDATRRRSAAALQAEEPEQRQVRLDANRRRHAAALQVEEPEQRQVRLDANRRRHAAALQVEEPEQRQVRLDANRRSSAAALQAEEPEQREVRLEATRRRSAAALQAEEPQPRQVRLDEDRRRHATALQAEETQQRQVRLQVCQQHRAESVNQWDRAAFNYDELRSTTTMAIQTQANRQYETAEQQVQRLETNNISTSQARASETVGQHRHSNSMAFTYDRGNPVNFANVGQMNDKCRHCAAMKFNGETKGVCCSDGKVILTPYPALPPFLNELISGTDATSRHFLANIRRYNGSFAMTSFGHKDAAVQGWNPSFRIQGQAFHRIGSLLPPEEGQPKFLQVYFLDSHADELTARNHSSLNPHILRNLTIWFHDNNHLIRQLKTAHDVLAEGSNNEERQIIIREDKRPHGEHARRYNAQSAPEVAILMDNEPTNPRDIVLRLRDGELKRISELHASYDSLQYPIIFPYGTDGYSVYLQARTAAGQDGGRKVSQLQYYSYHLMVREGNHLLQMGRLFQQFLVDMYCKIETERLGWIRREQKTLRADDYVSLRDSLFAGDGDPHNVGQSVVLPATYTGGPRWMHEKQSDAMAYVRRFGKPDFFITMTTNPKWTEIQENLQPGQEAQNRPDIIARVFRQKQKKLMELLKRGAFGKMQAFLYTIEYQKRGLPHAHILLWLAPESKVRPDDIDLVISAEIPDKEIDPELHKMVMAHMIHGPCGHLNQNSPCMRDRKCAKDFPKPFLQSTEQGNDCYPKYRRLKPEDGGHIGEINMHQLGRQLEQVVSNQWVVPYNPLLLRQFNSHINVEICSSISSIKYITKYVTKGTDQAVFQLQRIGAGDCPVDEVTQFQNARYVGSSEAVWRILEHPISQHFPPVVGLAVHLENGQRVYFNAENALERAQRPPPATTLTAFFDLCSLDDFAKTLKYHEVPQYYTWDKSSKKWTRRKQGGVVVRGDFTVHEVSAIGRMYSISPRQGDCYYVRLLLTDICGPTSFNALRSVDGQELSFREACLARGLLENDQHLHLAMEEAGISQSASNLRSLLAIILTSCFPSNPRALWEDFRNLLSEDYLFQHRRHIGNVAACYNDEVYNLALCALEDKVLLMGGSVLSSYDFPIPQRGTDERLAREYFREVDYDQDQLTIQANDLHEQLTDDQRDVYNAVLQLVEQGSVNSGMRHSNIIFLDAPGGTGKSFVINAILKHIRSQGKIALATASSGIAATLLQGGRTLHSTFKIPLDAHTKEQATCGIKRGTALARVINDAAVIIVDEAPMTHKSAYEAVDRTLQDITGVHRPMGGIPTLLCGDFRQILPVVKRGTRANIVNASLKTSDLWRHVTVKHLTRNMRTHLSGDQGAADFSKMLLEVGNGQIPLTAAPDTITIPTGLGKVVKTLEELKADVYPCLIANAHNHEWLAERAILSPLNTNVSKLNTWLMSEFPGEERRYKSVDSAICDDEAVTYPVELLNSIELSGMPPHILILKIGVPIMILRNMEPPKTTNGTRCFVTRLHANVIEATISCGLYKSEVILLPRIPLMPSDSELPFQFRRLQFPCKPCFSITINKSQGQTFKAIGVDLSVPCFTHGQLYVAASRTSSKEKLTILAPDSKTRNVVYTEALQN